MERKSAQYRSFYTILIPQDTNLSEPFQQINLQLCISRQKGKTETFHPFIGTRSSSLDLGSQ